MIECLSNTHVLVPAGDIHALRYITDTTDSTTDFQVSDK